MTEERKKELAETFWNDWLPARKSTAIEGLEFLIDTVATEAREEGREEGIEEAKGVAQQGIKDWLKKT